MRFIHSLAFVFSFFLLLNDGFSQCPSCKVCDGMGRIWVQARVAETRQRVVTLSDPGWVRWSGYTHYEWQVGASRRTNAIQGCDWCGGTGKYCPPEKPKPARHFYKRGPAPKPLPPPPSFSDVIEKKYKGILESVAINKKSYYTVIPKDIKQGEYRYGLIASDGGLEFHEIMPTRYKRIEEIEDENGDAYGFLGQVGERLDLYDLSGKLLKTFNNVPYWIHTNVKDKDMWVSVKNPGGENAAFYQENSYQLWDYETQKQILPGNYYVYQINTSISREPNDIFLYTAPSCGVCTDMWKEHGLLDVGVKVPDDDAGENTVLKGVVNRKGEVVIPLQFAGVYQCLNDGLIKMIDRSSLVRTFDINGNEILPEMKVVKTCADGNKIVEARYLYLNIGAKTLFTRDTITVQQLIDKDGNPLTSIDNTHCECFGEDGYARFQPIKEDVFLLSKEGEVYYEMKTHPSGVDMKTLRQALDQVEKTGDNHIQNQFSFLQKGGKWGIKDEKTGSILSQPTWDRIDIWGGRAGWKPMASVGDAPVNYPTYDPDLPIEQTTIVWQKQKDGSCRCGYVMPDGKLVKPIYESCSPFVHGLAEVHKDGLAGVLFKDGDDKVSVMAKPVYKAVDICLGHSNRALIQEENNLWGMVFYNGKILLEPEFDELLVTNNFFHYQGVKNGEKVFVKLSDDLKKYWISTSYPERFFNELEISTKFPVVYRYRGGQRNVFDLEREIKNELGGAEQLSELRDIGEAYFVGKKVDGEYMLFCNDCGKGYFRKLSGSENIRAIGEVVRDEDRLFFSFQDKEGNWGLKNISGKSLTTYQPLPGKLVTLHINGKTYFFTKEGSQWLAIKLYQTKNRFSVYDGYDILGFAPVD